MQGVADYAIAAFLRLLRFNFLGLSFFSLRIQTNNVLGVYFFYLKLYLCACLCVCLCSRVIVGAFGGQKSYLEWEVGSRELPVVGARDWTGSSAKRVHTLSPSSGHCSIPGNVWKRPQTSSLTFILGRLNLDLSSKCAGRGRERCRVDIKDISAGGEHYLLLYQISPVSSAALFFPWWWAITSAQSTLVVFTAREAILCSLERSTVIVVSDTTFEVTWKTG